VKIVIEVDSMAELHAFCSQIMAANGASVDCHINALPLNTRTRNILLAEGIETLKQLSMMSEFDLLKIPNMGRTSTAEIRGILVARGMA